MKKDILDGKNDKAIQSIQIIRSLLNDNSFKNKHRTASKYFLSLSQIQIGPEVPSFY
jgi:ribosomal protein S2